MHCSQVCYRRLWNHNLESCEGLPALQLGHMASLCVKVRVRTMCTLSFGEKKSTCNRLCVRLETSSNWGMIGFSEICCKRLFSSVKFREVCSLQRNPMLPILKSVRNQSFPQKTVKPAKWREVCWPVSCEPEGFLEEQWLWRLQHKFIKHFISPLSPSYIFYHSLDATVNNKCSPSLPLQCVYMWDGIF